MDKAVHAGDFCEIGGKLGTVEDIGLRSLRLRTLDQNLLVVPNSALASMQFQNMKARPKLLISQNFSLRIETRAEQLRCVLDRVQRMLDEHVFFWSLQHCQIPALWLRVRDRQQHKVRLRRRPDRVRH